MSQYRYTALSQNGALIVGEGAAASPEGLKADLENLGLRAQRIRAKRSLAKLCAVGSGAGQSGSEIYQKLSEPKHE